MATKQEIESVLKLWCNISAHPIQRMKEINSSNMGIGAVIRYLYEKGTNEETTAGEISSFLSVSTARVTVILKKMEKKGFITKCRAKNDKRITVVELTEYGKSTAQKMQSHFIRQIEKAIDKVGYERMLEFIRITEELCNVFEPPKDISNIE